MRWHDRTVDTAVGERRTPVHVVGGILVADGRVLLGHRSPSRRWYPDVWDIPGGHVEPGETGRAGMERELREELGVVVVTASALGTAHVGDVVIDLWTVTEWTGNPVNREPEEHDEVRWFGVDDLPVGTLAHPGLAPVLRAALLAPATQGVVAGR